MSKTVESKVADDTFTSKLGIELAGPREFERQIDLHAGSVDVACAIGPSGIGKTAIPKQVAARRNKGKGVPYVPIFMPTATQEGFFIPTTAEGTKVYFDQRIPRTFQKLLEWGAAMEDKHGAGKVPKDMCPILAVEELNRASDKSVTRAAFVLIGDRVIGDVALPGCVQIVATMNPSGGGFSVNEFEKDPAMRRRLKCFGIGYNYGDFMAFAQKAEFHERVVAYLGATPSAGYDELALGAGKAFACPATWESVSRDCYKLEVAKVPLDSTTARISIAGSIGSAAATAFLDYVKDHTLLVTPEDVMTRYTADSEPQRRFKAYLTEEGGRYDKVTDLTTGIAVRIFADLERQPEAIVDQLSLFAGDLPTEIVMSFFTKVSDEAQRVGSDAKSYLARLNQFFAQNKTYNEAMGRLHLARSAAQKKDA
jgi:hypothetical protein